MSKIPKPNKSFEIGTGELNVESTTILDDELLSKKFVEAMDSAYEQYKDTLESLKESDEQNGSSQS
ncbi:hypothetical protein [Levilactobacillus cerevisiae]|uniref:hypothetical protein n=1 Tax=Levilactobacillus cerevisiae TaxID=1704076 RepID=UPI000F7A3D1C|nr:hypothetical protein [Levilactobacillus cerevisiae]